MTQELKYPPLPKADMLSFTMGDMYSGDKLRSYADAALAQQAARHAIPPDCRTCQRFIGSGDGCTTVYTCYRGSQYAPTAPQKFWIDEAMGVKP